MPIPAGPDQPGTLEGEAVPAGTLDSTGDHVAGR